MALIKNIRFLFQIGIVGILFAEASSQSASDIPVSRFVGPILLLKEDLPVGSKLADYEVSNGVNPRCTSSSQYIKLTENVISSNRATYNVILADKLDYETMGASISITVLCSNTQYHNLPSSFKIFIQNVNDELPVLINRPYDIYVPENTTRGTTVYSNIDARDADSGDTKTFYLTAVDPQYQSVFTIDPHNAHIKLNGSLDFETTRFYQFTVVVKDKDNQHNATANVFITVEDVQDEPPYFTGAPYQMTVTENSPIGTSLIQVLAADGDRGLQNSVALTITSGSTCPGLFTIDSKSGVISLKSVPDRDSGILLANNGLCHLRIEVKEGHEHPQASTPVRDSSNVDVTITVLDVDENPPMFDSLIYNATVQENTQAGVPINLLSPINVKDIDQGDNAKFEVRVVNLPDTFEVSPSIVQSQADIIIRVKDPTYLDYEKRQAVTIMIDTKTLGVAHTINPATANITLNLINVNDEVPIFENFQSKVQIPENVPIHFNVANITAKDGDMNDDGNNFGKVTYHLESPDQMFTINPNNGSIFTNSLLDRELRDFYYVIVVAEDGGGRKVTNQLTIELIDVNDNTPSFETNDYQTSLLEEATNFNRPVVVHATDNDQPNTVNSQVDYSIIETNPIGLLSHFSINSTSGQINLLSPLSYDSIFPGQEQGSIVLTVMAKDRGSPPLYSTVNVTVILQDTNNKAPVCNEGLYSVVNNERSKECTTAASTSTSSTIETTTSSTIGTTTTPTIIDSTQAPTTRETASVLPETSLSPEDNVRHDFICHVTTMEIFIPNSFVPNSQLWLRDPSCVLVNNGTHHVITIPYDQCGTTIGYYNDYMEIQNDITVHLNIQVSAPVVFAGDSHIHLQCQVPRHTLIDASFQTVTNDPIQEVDGNKNPYFHLKEFTSADYTHEITKYPVQVSINKEVFLEISLTDETTKNTTLGVKVNDCHATPSSDPHDSTSYQLIKDSCPATPAVHLQPSPGQETYRFSAQAFHFSGNSNNADVVFIHCDVSICPANACGFRCDALGSLRRKRKRNAMRFKGAEPTTTLTSGPYIIF